MSARRSARDSRTAESLFAANSREGRAAERGRHTRLRLGPTTAAWIRIGSASVPSAMGAYGRILADWAATSGAPHVTDWVPSCTTLVAGLIALSCGGQTSSSAKADEGQSFDQAAMAEEALAAHNLVRSEVTQPPNYPGAWSALPAMVWSNEVAVSAQAWADSLKAPTLNCRLTHEDGGTLGENVAGGYFGYSPKRAVADWTVEKQDYTFNPVYLHDDAWGHYTQIVWRDSTELGCGMAFCDNGTNVIVCRYRPAGNVRGAQPY